MQPHHKREAPREFCNREPGHHPMMRIASRKGPRRLSKIIPHMVGGVVWGWVAVGSELSVEAPLCEARRSLRVTPTPEIFVAAMRGLSLSLFLSFSLPPWRRVEGKYSVNIQGMLPDSGSVPRGLDF